MNFVCVCGGVGSTKKFVTHTDELVVLALLCVTVYCKEFSISETFPFFHGATAPGGPGTSHYRGFTITLRHTTLGRTPLDE